MDTRPISLKEKSHANCCPGSASLLALPQLCFALFDTINCSHLASSNGGTCTV
jgi:hypothetical protein